MNAHKPLEGKTAIVTGAGTGIGKAIAVAFSEAGAQVVLAGRSRETLDPVAAAIGGKAVLCNVTRIEDVENLFGEALELSGRIDVLVNNAGQSGPIAPIADVDLDAWRECFEVNVLGVVNCLKVAAQIMTQQRSGSIINMSSLMGLTGYPMRSAYSASKFAIIGLTEAVAREVGPANVRVNALCPGAVNGELMERVIARRAAAEGRSAEEIIKSNYTDVAALRRWVEPEEVAATALFLASDASSSITGDRMKVDCGRF
ncbi:MAG: SDR family oxidoreductase [Salinarimonadaceae bacterium]|nr:MAG: SDR family oxidoreductase [Salinarimonadaceae bacterium]